MADAEPPPDAELDSFVERYLTSFAAWDTLVLLDSQRGLRDSAKHLAYRLGRNESDIAEALQAMRLGGLVTAEAGEGEVLYALAPDAWPILERFAAACAGCEWRLELVRHVLARLGKP